MDGKIKAIAIAIALAVPAVSFGQPSNGPLTRAQVRAQLIQLERAGYNPAEGNRGSHYPRDIQAAEARVAAQNGTSGTSGMATGMGGTTTSASESGHQTHTSSWIGGTTTSASELGHQTHTSSWNPMYRHH
ncbi:uncharacterized protein DUF4148 [Trinickia symbiotica]|uniref:DUF4148 domain-containing protein n=1 Tax=Trinickia symbiotica TaxID=863227 RepID=A0A2N7X820_9BURK|nr:DUF4148 domain-containing protein [Trinickia symbiotica]PMS37731.1 DUF4148 domain-containing protein [Trinickia symbiotica]PPK44274.1 uncharacterized protein DUF4148 [Trinickia symbiotica]